MSKKGVILISNVTKAMEHEWFCEMINRQELQPEFILFNSRDSELYRFIRSCGFPCRNYHLTKLTIPLQILKLSAQWLFKRPDFVHSHLFEASLIGMTAAKLAGIRKRIHTRHHGDFHHRYFPSAVKYDRLINRLSTHIIAVSETVKGILLNLERVEPSKVIVVLHGIPSRLFDQHDKDKSQELAKKYHYQDKNPVIGVMSRFTEWKGVQFTIEAFRQILPRFPAAHLVLANASGDYEPEIKRLLQTVPAESYSLIPFENDGLALMQSFDIFVHVPVSPDSEAFGQVYLEALFSGTPMVCTLSGIANDIIHRDRNAAVVPYRNADAITEAIVGLLTDADLRNRLTRQGRLDAGEFTFEKKFEKLRKLYLE